MKDKFENMIFASLTSIYFNDPEIIKALALVDYTKVAYKFKQELFARMTKEDYDEIDTFLRSDKYENYVNAVNQSTLALTNDLAKLIELVVMQPEEKGRTN
jgi:phage anti-repressor protein